MIGPIIGLFIFLTLISIVIYIGNNNRQKEYNFIIESINDQILMFIQQAKSITTTIGLKNRDYLFSFTIKAKQPKNTNILPKNSAA